VVALRLGGAVEADPVTYARLHNLVEGLCIASGLPKPQIYVIDDVAPNAFATGRSPKHATVAVTTGLLDLLDRVELEGVLAHELSHIKNHDILVATLAVTMVGLVTPQLVPFAVDRRREPLADVSAVEMTRYPPGLISALEKLRRDSTAVAASSRAIAHLWIEAPSARPDEGEGTERTATASTHPPIEERIAALREL
jgi:heat shock protein HtpX